LLQSTESQQMDLRQLDGIIERATSRSQARGIEVTRFTAALRAEDDRHMSTRWLWVVGTLVVLCCVTMVWVVWYKLLEICCPNRKHCTGRPSRSQNNDGKHSLSKCDIGLQVLPSEGRGPTNQAIPTDASDGVGPTGHALTTNIASKSQESLTLFALRGRGLPGDPE
jgi:hypothetical protein